MPAHHDRARCNPCMPNLGMQGLCLHENRLSSEARTWRQCTMVMLVVVLVLVVLVLMIVLVVLR